MEDVQPVVTTKPVRGREMKTNVVPLDMLDTMRMVSAKKTLENEDLAPVLETPREAKAELYHEGYVDGKLYLVPDSNLEAMKDMINFKMRPRKSTRYRHQTSYEISDYDHFRGKLDALLAKIDKIQDIDSEPSQKSDEKKLSISSSKDTLSSEKSSEEVVEEDEVEEKVDEEIEEEEDKVDEELEEEEEVDVEEEVKVDEEVEEEEDKVDEELEEEEEVDVEEKVKVDEEVEEEEVEKEETEEEVSEDKQPEEEEPKLTSETEADRRFEEESDVEYTESEPTEHAPIYIRDPEPDKYYLRFLVSGHFQNDKKPIYIIQEYNGKPDIFKDQKADFFSPRKEGNVDVFISGKFYNENILETSDGKPVALQTKPEKIPIYKEKSKVYEDHFEDIYNLNTVDISVKGDFVQSKITKKITPFLTLGVKQKSLFKFSQEKEKDFYNDKAPPIVLVYEPKYENPFLKLSEQEENTDIKLKNNSNSSVRSSISAPSFKSPTIDNVKIGITNVSYEPQRILPLDDSYKSMLKSEESAEDINPHIWENHNKLQSNHTESTAFVQNENNDNVYNNKTNVFKIFPGEKLKQVFRENMLYKSLFVKQSSETNSN